MSDAASVAGRHSHRYGDRHAGIDPVAVSCLVAGALGLVALLLPSGQPKFALLVLFAVTGPGCAIVAQLRTADGYLAIPLIVVGSLAVSAALPTLMLWANWWHPVFELSALAVLCALSGCVALRRRPR